MELSRTERYMISNQLKILEALYPDDAKYYEHNREAFERGYEQHYRWAMEHVYEETLSLEATSEITEILSMFDAMQYAYERLTDKSGIDADRIRFFGFDANTEATALGYARYFCRDVDEDGGKFQNIERGPENWNSHAPFMPMYRAMLSAWRNSSNPLLLGKSDLIRVTEVKYPG